MSINEIIDEALTLKPQERYKIIESLYESLCAPNIEIEEIWIEESTKRMKSIDNGTMKTVPYRVCNDRLYRTSTQKTVL